MNNLHVTNLLLNKYLINGEKTGPQHIKDKKIKSSLALNYGTVMQWNMIQWKQMNYGQLQQHGQHTSIMLREKKQTNMYIKCPYINLSETDSN